MSGSNSTEKIRINGVSRDSLASDTQQRVVKSDITSFNFENEEDFQRLLASYDLPHVIDTLRRYLAVEVQSSVLGAASKQQSAHVKRKFYERFNEILDRIFGNDENSKRKYGGWLDYSNGIASSMSIPRMKPTSVSTSTWMENYVNSLTSSGRALVAFLGFVKEEEAGSIFQFLFKMIHPVEFKLEFSMLPEQSRVSILNRSIFTSVLFTQLLQKPITKQRMDTRNPVLLLSIKELYLFYFMRHPASASHQGSGGSSSAAATSNLATGRETDRINSPTGSSTSSSSSIIGSISDTLSGRTKRRAEYSWRSFYHDGMISLTRGNPYNVLLLQYLEAFFPDTLAPVQSRFRGKILQYSSLFLHILIEFWLRQNLIVFADDPSNPLTPPVMETTCMAYRAPRLSSPFAAVHTQTSYMAPSDDLLSSLLLTIIHLLSDSSFTSVKTSSSTSSVSISAGNSTNVLTPSVSVLRRPLYEFLRLIFSRAPIGLSPTAFFAIVDVWIVYIQPWHCVYWAKGQEPPSSSMYTVAWESFVLANYHFYTTLLGAFVERAKELDLTGSDERSLVMLDRVMAIFTPELLSLLRLSSDFMDVNQQYAIPTISTSGISSRLHKKTSTTNISETNKGLSPSQGQTLIHYTKSLGIECVGVPLHASYHRDAERLFDKLWSDSGFTGAEGNGAGNKAPTRPSRPSFSSVWSGVSVETPFERVHRLSRHLRRVFEISDAYVASTAHSRSLQPSSLQDGLDAMHPSRDQKRPHLLTREGIRQLRTGIRMCSPDEACYIGDPMLRPICSYEIRWLVRVLYRLSVWLNTICGFESPYRGKRFTDNVHVEPSMAYTYFRFNLRFLASKPNLVLLSFFGWIVYLILLW